MSLLPEGHGGSTPPEILLGTGRRARRIRPSKSRQGCCMAWHPTESHNPRFTDSVLINASELQSSQVLCRYIGSVSTPFSSWIKVETSHSFLSGLDGGTKRIKQTKAMFRSIFQNFKNFVNYLHNILNVVRKKRLHYTNGL